MYTSLDSSKREIRLLVPVGGDVSRLIFDVQTVSLDEKPEYHAISYEWRRDNKTYVNGIAIHDGPTYQDGIVTFNGVDVTVGTNLGRCLFSLKANDEMSERKFWIDALCINQSDNTERGQQVALMREIYATARTTFVWIGPASEDSDLAMNLVNELGQVGDSNNRNEYLKEFQALTKPWNLFSWQAVMDLLARSYWSRLWIVQELAVSENSLVCCGQKRLGLTDLFRATLDLNSDMGDLETGTGAIAFSKGYSRQTLQITLTIGIWKDFKKIPGVDLSLLGFLARTSFHKYMEKHDRVYALCGLAQWPRSTALGIDYDESLRQHYIRVARFIIHSSGSLDVLRHSQYGLNVDLPSWSRDWSRDFISLLAFSGEVFNASGLGDACVQFEGENLRVDMIRIGTLEEFDDRDLRRSEPQWELRKLAAHVLTSWCSINLPNFPPRNPDAHSWQLIQDAFTPELKKAIHPALNAIEATVVAGLGYPRKQGAVSNVDALLAYYLHPEIVPPQPRSPEIGQRPILNKRWDQIRFASCTFDPNIPAELHSYPFAACNKEAQIGDVIGIIKGCSVPLLLRNAGNGRLPRHFRIVGDIYMHTFMHGAGAEFPSGTIWIC